MKKLFTLLAFILSVATFAQAPQGFNYQATVRNASGTLMVNQNVFFKFNIMLNTQTSNPIYSETHDVPTDDLGQVNLTIGKGTATTGIFSAINWGAGNYYLGVELNSGSGYVAMGTSQLLSVPYALYANSSGSTNFNLPNGTNVGDILNWIWNGTAWTPTVSISTAQLPVITTVSAYGAETPTPYSGGNIITDGGYSITSYGVCWSLNPNPTINNYSTNDGNGASNFTSALTDLLPTTTYYYRAYATNSIGTGYGITYTFTTIDIPKLTTSLTSEITITSATSGGTITSDGGGEIYAKGVCWSASPNPTIALTTKTNNGAGTDLFTSSIEGLSLITTYYVRAYATNSYGTAYGNEISFTTSSLVLNVPGPNVTDIDGNIYQTVTNCNQTWTKTNLNVSKYRNGDIIPQVTDPAAWGNLTTGAWCYYNNDSANGITYGKLYNWYAVKDPRGLAPVGYHIPTDAEWTTLTSCLGGYLIAGKDMKESGTTHWASPNTVATNSSGFTALPGGERDRNGNSNFVLIGDWGFFWSSSAESTMVGAQYLSLYKGSSQAGIGGHNKTNGFSVRCLKD